MTDAYNDNSAPALRFRPARVLVVDDSPLFRDCIETILLNAMCLVRSASNGAEALRMLLLEKYDCVFMDVHMPVMDGIEAIRQIRSIPSISDIKVIAMTAEVSPKLQEQCLLVGADDVIGKAGMKLHQLSELAGVIAKPAYGSAE